MLRIVLVLDSTGELQVYGDVEYVLVDALYPNEDGTPVVEPYYSGKAMDVLPEWVEKALDAAGRTIPVTRSSRPG